MSSSSRGASRVARTLASSSPKSNHICISCRKSLARRAYASTATAQATSEPPTVSQLKQNIPVTSSLPEPTFTINAGVLLSRPPLITPDPHPFQTAYYLYQRRLNERLVLPFTQYFYYKSGTPSFEHWRTKRRERGGVATRDIGPYNAYTKESWNDEVLVGNRDGEPETIVKKLVEEEGRAEEFVSAEGGTGDLTMAGLRRRTEADEKNDQRSLERALSRTLYLLVKRKGRSNEPERTLWAFPSAPLSGKEALKQGAQRVLGSACGVNMNTWFVGSHPVGHLVRLNKPLEPAEASKKLANVEEMTVNSEKTFFMKARIMAGQADVKGNQMDIEDFKWLAKDEIEKVVSPYYWSRVKNMLVEQ